MSIYVGENHSRMAHLHWLTSHPYLAKKLNLIIWINVVFIQWFICNSKFKIIYDSIIWYHLGLGINGCKWDSHSTNGATSWLTTSFEGQKNQTILQHLLHVSQILASDVPLPPSINGLGVPDAKPTVRPTKTKLPTAVGGNSSACASTLGKW